MVPFFLFLCVALGLLFFFSSGVNTSKQARNINDIITHIMKSDMFDFFSLIKKTEEEEQYYYGENHYKFSIVCTDTHLSFTIKHDATVLVYAVYHNVSHFFEEKSFSPNLTNVFKTDEKTIESFIQWIISSGFQAGRYNM